MAYDLDDLAKLIHSLISPSGDGRLYTQRDGDFVPENGWVATRGYLTVEHVQRHLAGMATHGAVAGSLTRLGVLDLDAHSAEHRETLLARLRAVHDVISYSLDARPLLVSTPSGVHVLVTTATATTPKILHSWLQAIVDALPRHLQHGIDLRPGLGQQNVRLPLGRGLHRDSGEWIQGRIVDVCRNNLYASPADDLCYLGEHLDAAEIVAQLGPDEPMPGEIARAAKAIQAAIRPPKFNRRKLPTVAFPVLSDRPEKTEYLEHCRQVELLGIVSDKSAGELASIRDIVFRRLVYWVQPETEVIDAIESWAERAGVPVRRALQTARGTIRRFQEKLERGELYHPIPTGRPREVTPRLLDEPEMIDAILARVQLAGIRDTARVLAGMRSILLHLREHGTVDQEQLNRLVTGKKIRVHGKPRTLVVCCRESLGSWLHLICDYSVGHHSAWYGLDYRPALALRRELGLPEITRDGELVPCPRVDSLIETAAEKFSKLDKVRLLLADGVAEEIARRSVSPARCTALLATLHDSGEVEQSQDNSAALGAYGRAAGETRLLLDFRAVTALRVKELGLADARIVTEKEGSTCADPFVIGEL